MYIGAQAITVEGRVCFVGSPSAIYKKRTKMSKITCLCSVEDCYTCAEAVIRFSTGSSALEAATNNQSHRCPLQH